MAKEKRSALDRGFPTGTVLIFLAIIIVVLQGISAWKVINLEHERADIEKMGALLQKDINDFEKMKKELPILNGERNRLKKEIPELEGKKNDLAIQVANIEAQLAKARETIERSKEVEKIKINLEKVANEFKAEIENRTNEITRLAGPNSQIIKSADELNILINTLDKAPKYLDQVIMQAKKQVNSSMNTLNKASTDLQTEVSSFSKTSKTMISDLHDVSETANSVINNVKDAEKLLSQQTENLSESSKQFAAQINAIDSNIENLTNNNKKLSNETTEATIITSDMDSTAGKFKKLYADKKQVFNKNNEQMNSLAAQLKTEINSLKTAVDIIKAKNEEFLNKTTIIGSTVTDLSMVVNKVKKLSSEAEVLFLNLSNYTASLEPVIGTLKDNGGIIKNVGNDLQRASDGLGTNVNKMSEKIDIIERDVADFSRKIEAFNSSKVEGSIKTYINQLSKNMGIISSGSDNLSNLNQNMERVLNKLQDEIESFTQLLQKRRESFTKSQATPFKTNSE